MTDLSHKAHRELWVACSAVVPSALCTQVQGGEFGIDAACECLRGLTRYVRFCAGYMRVWEFAGLVGFGCEKAREA